MKHRRTLIILTLFLLWGSGELLAHARRLSLPDPFGGTYEGEFRHTIGQPSVYTMTIWLYGNSTMEGAYATDDQTIASLLQANLPSVRIMNRGVGGAGIAREYEYLSETPLRPGDLVVFYDGGMELTAITRAALQESRARYPCARLFDLLAEWHLITMDVLCGWALDPTPWFQNEAWLGPHAQYQLNLRQTVLSYARTYSRAHGAAFMDVLQAVPCTLPGEALRRECMLNVRLWPEIERLGPELDLTHVLDNARQAGRLVFIDGAHVNGAANALIAQALYAYLAQEF